MTDNNNNKHYYLDVDIEGRLKGRIKFELFTEKTPKTCRNFSTLLTSNKYNRCPFHRIIPGFMAQGGDFENRDGTGGFSVFGKTFSDENFDVAHERRGMLSMANAGPNTNGSQFFITFKALPHLDGRHVVFGACDLSDPFTARAVDALEAVVTGRDDAPLSQNVCILRGGLDNSAVISDNTNTNTNTNTEEVDHHQEMIDLDDNNGDGGGDNEEKGDQEEEEEEEEATQMMNPLQKRLFKLKMKMNQSRNLNRKEVMIEGQILGTEDGMVAEKKRLKDMERESRKNDWLESNKKAAMGNDADEAVYMFQQASDSQRKSMRKQEKAKANQYDINDYYNPQGQQRNYERNLKSLPTLSSSSSAAVYDPLSYKDNDAGTVNTGSDGVRRLADELRRRGEKAEKNKRGKPDFDAGDVNYINKRNKKFNEKIGRNYDKYTAEIKQNLERGTAL